MSGMWRLFRADLRRATSNVMAMILLSGLIVIPSAFTWFNVIGSWQPFDNTGDLKVAVASVDEGYTSPLIPLHINVGAQVESALRANHELDWVFTTEDEAIAGTESGEYYAAMVLPKDFSERMLTFYAPGAQPTQIDYYTNDKSNPLTPLITSQGADALTAKVNAEFTQELTNVALSLVSGLATSLDDGEAQAALSDVRAHVSAVAVQLRTASTTATMFTALIQASMPLVEGASGLLQDAESQFADATGQVQEGAEAAQRAETSITQAGESLTEALRVSTARVRTFSEDLNSILDSVDENIEERAERLQGVADNLDDLVTQHEALVDQLVNEVAPTIPEEDRPAFDALVEQLQGAIEDEAALQDLLATAASGITTGVEDLAGLRGQVDESVQSALTSLEEAADIYDGELKPTLDDLAASLTAAATTLNGVAQQVADSSSAASGATGVLETAAADNQAVADTLTQTADKIDEVVAAIDTAIDTGDLSDLASVIGSDPSVLATAISQPIGLKTVAVYPVVSFGAGMAPLYTTLALWVGSLLVGVTLRVQPPERVTAHGAPLTPSQQFLGRYGIFAVMALAQSTLVGLGNLVLVGLDPVYPWLLMLTLWASSLVFSFIIYTLIVSFGDAGKALAVFLLVIQVAGAGGAYPLALLPQWFQNISPFLPATHAIDAFRSALAGIYDGDYWVSMGWLLAFVVPMLLLGLVVRRPLMGLNHWVERSLASTKLM